AFLVKPPSLGLPWTRLVLLVVLAAALAALCSRAPLTLGQLRGIELLGLGALTAYYVWNGSDFVLVTRTGSPVTLADSANMGFMFIVFGYGVFIPNTWRRCLLVLSGIVAVAAGGQLYGLTRRPLPVEFLVFYVVETSIIVGLSTALAVYGAHRLSILRQRFID